jgi:hypothetical protein
MARLRRLGLERQKSGVRGKEQESEVRSQNKEHLVRTFCSVFRALRSSLTGWVFLADPAAAGHAIIFPPFPVTISRVIESVKVGSTLRINAGRGERGLLSLSTTGLSGNPRSDGILRCTGG